MIGLRVIYCNNCYHLCPYHSFYALIFVSPLEVAIGCTVICRASAIIYWEYSSLWRLFCYHWAVHCSVDTNTIWWYRHNYSKSTFIRKYICTIKGLELHVVLGEKLHGHALSRQAEPPFVQQEAHPPELSLRLSAGGWNAEVFHRQPPKSWK